MKYCGFPIRDIEKIGMLPFWREIIASSKGSFKSEGSHITMSALYKFLHANIELHINSHFSTVSGDQTCVRLIKPLNIYFAFCFFSCFQFWLQKWFHSTISLYFFDQITKSKTAGTENVATNCSPVTEPCVERGNFHTQNAFTPSNSTELPRMLLKSILLPQKEIKTSASGVKSRSTSSKVAYCRIILNALFHDRYHKQIHEHLIGKNA